MEDGSIGAAAGLYLLGKITHNETARETGVLGIEAVIDATVAVEVIKAGDKSLAAKYRRRAPGHSGRTMQTFHAERDRFPRAILRSSGRLRT